jgi:peptidoglycan DL-endopeptidase CwlO
MQTVGYIFVLAAFLLIRALTKGRSISQMPGDITDALDAAITGDTAKLSEVLARTGDTSTPTTVTTTGGVTGTSSGTTYGPGTTYGGVGLLAEVKRLGGIAKGVYKLGGTGPGSYDCSGLVYRALANLGYYKGPRFTTITFPLQCRSIIAKTTTPTPGDIAWWPGHMGVVDGNGTFYSALSTKSGIRSGQLSWIGGSPVFYKLVNIKELPASMPIPSVSPANR